jgi:hypothetical protein
MSKITISTEVMNDRRNESGGSFASHEQNKAKRDA